MSRRPASAPLVLIAALAIARTACVGPGTDSQDAARAALLADVGPQVVLPALRRFQDAADALVAALATDDAAGARAAFGAAAAAWQEVEAMQVGPLASSLDSAAGEDLRDGVYSWPTVNPCRVDQETFAQGYAAEGFLAAAAVNVTGLDALEALLFRPSAQEECPSQVGIDEGWAGLGDAERDARRAAYARVLADDVAARAAALVARWDPAAGDFGGALAAAGAAGSVWASPADAVDHVFAAAYYVETHTKALKLAVPLGLATGTPDPTAVESLWSAASTPWIAANLRGFRALFTGGDGFGFDDLLAAAGEDALSAEILAATDAALAAAQAIELPLEQALLDDAASVQALYNAVDALVDLLRDDVTVAVSVRVPSEAAGDND